nr:IS701 family transposase [Gluconobacter sp. P1D12_c]
MTGGASVEETLSVAVDGLRVVKDKMRPLFGQARVAVSAEHYLETLLGNLPRKTGWQRAEAAGDEGPWRQQALLGRTQWDADGLRDIVRNHVQETLSDKGAVLVVDETGFLKKGKASCGVGRQYTGSAGKITNCQIGVFAVYVSSRGHAFVDRALYLPKAWSTDPTRLTSASVPESRMFATKPTLAREMIERSLYSGLPFEWVAADSVYGVGEIEMSLRHAAKGYVLGVAGSHWFNSWGLGERPVAGEAREIAQDAPREDWVSLSAGHGTKGERIYDWLWCPLAELQGADYIPADDRVWIRGLLVRRNPVDGDLAYFTVWCPSGTTLEKLVQVEGTRWRIEEGFRTAKNEFGLDHNETRSWHGWHRHVSFVMLAYALMAGVRAQANDQPSKKRQRARHKV